MAYMRWPCGCERDDEALSAEHTKGPEQSEADRDRKLHHYPEILGPAEWCNAHKQERPCACDETKTKPKKANPKPKRKKR